VPLEPDPAPESAPAPELRPEPLGELQRLFEHVENYFELEHPVDTFYLDEQGQPVPIASHRCPTDPKLDFVEGISAVVPALTANCGAGPDGTCVPTDAPSQVHEYAISAWADDPIFAALGFSEQAPHRFHYGVRAINSLGGYGACMFTVQAFGDLDSDGVYSTYELYGAGDQTGVASAEGYFVDKPDE
jgi:hypothetical protein